MRNKRTGYSLLIILTFLFMNVSFTEAADIAAVSSPFPIAATESKEFSQSMAFDETNYLVAIQDDVDVGDFILSEITAQLISPLGDLIGGRIVVPPVVPGDACNYGPRPVATGVTQHVAFDGTNYLMVWSDDCHYPDNDLAGQLIGADGSLIGSPFFVNQAEGRQESRGIKNLIFGGGKYLAVWQDGRNDTNYNRQCDSSEGSCTDIYGQLISPSGVLVGTEIAISTGSENQVVPSIGFDGTNYLAAYASRRSGDPERWDIYGQFVTTSGTLSGAPFVISETPSSSFNAIGIAFDGTSYLVAWNRDIGLGYPNPTIWDIYGRMVSPAGTFPGNEFPITISPGDQVAPFIAFDGSNYFVAWSDLRNDLNDNWICDINEGTCTDIYGQYVSRSGEMVGEEVVINAEAGDQLDSPVLFAAGKYFVVWNNMDFDYTFSDVYGQFRAKTRFEESDPAISYIGAWSSYPCASCSGGALKYSKQTNARAGFSFGGTRTKWLVTKGPMMGKAKVYLDGVSKGLLDLYNATTKYKQTLQATGLASGSHTVAIEVSGQKNANATDKIINIDAFEVTP